MAIAWVASAHSALVGRAPTGHDIDFALVVLGYEPDGIPTELVAGLSEGRVAWFAGAAHHPANLHDFVAAIDVNVLRLTAEQARTEMAQGTQLISH